jgi:hypothetical protein
MHAHLAPADRGVHTVSHGVDVKSQCELSLIRTCKFRDNLWLSFGNDTLLAEARAFVREPLTRSASPHLTRGAI